MAEKRYQNSAAQVLDIIMKQNPKITHESIELFAKIYYPIAILEITMEERSFEEFDFVPLTVLKFVNCGACTADEISRLMGLNPKYVEKVLELLRGYGYITGQGITALGRESASQNQKISTTKVTQNFQADALTGDLLRLEEQTKETNLEDRDEIWGNIPIVPHLQGVTVEQVNRQLKSADLQEYKKYRGEILHANAESITGIRCTALEYVEAFMLKLEGCKTPFIMTHQYDASIEDFNDRFRWQPMRMPDRNAAWMYGFDEKVPCYEGESLDKIDQLYQMMCDRCCGVPQDKLVDELDTVYPFNSRNLSADLDRLGKKKPVPVFVDIDVNSFSKWDGFVFRFLANYNLEEGDYLYPYPKLNGLILRFRTSDPQLIKYIKLWQSALAAHPGRDIVCFVEGALIPSDKSKISNVDFTLLDKKIKEFEAYEKEKAKEKEQAKE